MASVAKWLRQRIVVPPFVGSSPIVRPNRFEPSSKFFRILSDAKSLRMIKAPVKL